jgi:hypothetical protein
LQPFSGSRTRSSKQADPEDGSSKHLRYVDKLLAGYTTSYATSHSHEYFKPHINVILKDKQVKISLFQAVEALRVVRG